MTKKTLLIFASLALMLAVPFTAPVSAAAKSAQIVQQLKARGATFVPMSRLPAAFAAKPRLDRYDCDSVACWCSGGADCLALIDEKGANCTHFRCGNDHGTPVCWCEL
jgi:hypothetical protein